LHESDHSDEIKKLDDKIIALVNFHMTVVYRVAN